MKKRIITCSLLLACGWLSMQPVSARRVTFNMSDFGISPNTQQDMGPALQKALKEIKSSVQEKDKVVLNFSKGTYNFHVSATQECTYYISNHDQDQPKRVMFNLADWHNLSINGNGADFIFHGRLIPFAIVNCTNTTLENFSIDFSQPQIGQIEILKNNSDGITFKVAPWMTYQLDKEKGTLTNLGEGWENQLSSGIAFEGETRHVVYNTGDIGYDLHDATEISPRIIHAPKWKDSRMIPGTVIAMRSWYRPAPGIFANESKNTTFKNVKVHYAEGMGVLAQVCENVRLDGLKVCFNPTDSSRYITTIVDATHFSHCRGKIVSANGFYEHMGDDAINVHGIYLDVQERVDDHTVVGKFMYEQTYGFDWGFAGDTVQFVSKVTSEPIGVPNRIARIEPLDESAPAAGMRSFKIAFENTLPRQVDGAGTCSMENLTWTPEVYFVNNVVRDNRARGALFTTPRKVVVRSNVFDHVSGSAILISGDCSYWYESGACRDVLISDNKFIQALTSLYMESNAVISISPVVKELRKQVRCFHGGRPDAIRIVNNLFELADVPVLYVKSVDGLLFKDNVIRTNPESVPFHWNRSRFCLEHTGVVNIVE